MATPVSPFNPSVHPRGFGGKFISGAGNSTGSQKASAGAAKRLGGKINTANIKAFQKAHGLVVDGVIGRQTAAALLGDTKAGKIPIGAMTQAQVAALEKVAGGTLAAQIGKGTPKPSPKPTKSQPPTVLASRRAGIGSKIKPGTVRVKTRARG